MQFYICKAKKRSWTHKAGREALGVEAGDRVRLTHKNQHVTVQICRAPLSASRVLRAVQNATGAMGIAVEQHVLSSLGCRPGDAVEAVNVRALEEARPAAPRQISSGTAQTLNGGSLKDRLKALKVGQVLEVSESQAKSGAYTAAKAAGIKIKRLPGKNAVQRI